MWFVAGIVDVVARKQGSSRSVACLLMVCALFQCGWHASTFLFRQELGLQGGSIVVSAINGNFQIAKHVGWKPIPLRPGEVARQRTVRSINCGIVEWWV